MTTVHCPTCASQVAWNADNRYRPFCCARCKEIDLGAWAAGDYVISAPAPENDNDALPDGSPPVQ